MRRVFGYGSLVNAATLPTGLATLRAELPGWIRQWRNPRLEPAGPICGLTVQRAERSTIQGVLFELRDDLQEALLLREGEDELTEVTAKTLEEGREVKSHVFVTPASRLRWASDECPICLSYLHCILAGYLNVYGRAGIEAFLDSTLGWHLPLLDDTAKPRYPRALHLSPDQLTEMQDCLRARQLLI